VTRHCLIKQSVNVKKNLDAVKKQDVQKLGRHTPQKIMKKALFRNIKQNMPTGKLRKKKIFKL